MPTLAELRTLLQMAHGPEDGQERPTEDGAYIADPSLTGREMIRVHLVQGREIDNMPRWVHQVLTVEEDPHRSREADRVIQVRTNRWVSACWGYDAEAFVEGSSQQESHHDMPHTDFPDLQTVYAQKLGQELRDTVSKVIKSKVGRGYKCVEYKIGPGMNPVLDDRGSDCRTQEANKAIEKLIAGNWLQRQHGVAK